LNLLLTRFMLERAQSAMATARSPFDFTEPTAYFPAAPSINDLKSNADAVALAMSSYDDPTGQTGYLGVMDAATAAFYGLPTVKIENAQKTGFVSANPASIAAGVAAMTTNADGTAIANLAPADPAAYPLPITSFAQVPTSKMTDSKISAAIKAMLSFVVSPGQQNHLLDGYVPLTDKQKTATQHAETLVGSQAEPSPTPTPTPSDSASPTATPTDSALPTPTTTPDSGSGTDSGSGFGGGTDTGIDIGTGTGVDGGTGTDSGAGFGTGSGVDGGGQTTQQNGAGVIASSIFDSTQTQKSSLPGFTLVVFAMAGVIPLGLSAWKSSWRKQS
jgi:hypothetical protein